MWGPRIAGARKNKQQLLWIFIALFWESYLSSSSKQSHLNTVAGWDAMKSEVFVGQSLFNVHSTTGLFGEGWSRGALEEWLASSSLLAGCFNGSPQCWETTPRTMRLLLHPSCPVGTRAGRLTYGPVWILVGILKSMTTFVQSQCQPFPLCAMEDFKENSLQWELSWDILQHGNDNIYS